jgi:hypothetical protein
MTKTELPKVSDEELMSAQQALIADGLPEEFIRFKLGGEKQHETHDRNRGEHTSNL